MTDNAPENEVPEVSESVEDHEVDPADVVDLVKNEDQEDHPGDPWADKDPVQDPEAVSDGDEAGTS